ncbi:pyridoxamine 5'-phosphate oxidase family protein [Streptomyces sp. NPDC048566]|uniref:pyridoxamine 5'-phosphate oxidase family protein n=1 Tax=Streptomyces sp. NPDC048566 TaxID=3365569 RepID=UPI00371D0AE2
MHGLSPAEREAFLAEPHVTTPGVAAGGDRGPLLVPIRYGYEPGDTPWILTGADSRKMGLIRAASRFSLLVQRVEPTPRYVSVEGPVAEIAEPAAGVHRGLAARYLSGEALDRYAAWAGARLGDHVPVRMRPAHWTGADLGSVG